MNHKERVLAATREENARLMAELVHTRQVAQHTANLEAGRVAALTKAAAEREAMKEKEAKAKEALLSIIDNCNIYKNTSIMHQR